jgi:hypothetical protein
VEARQGVPRRFFESGGSPGDAGIDGDIGKIDEASYDVGASYVVVDTGPWIFGGKVMLPASVIQQVDLDLQTVFVDRTMDEIKNSPEFHEDTYRDDAYRSRLGSYYYGDLDRLVASFGNGSGMPMRRALSFRRAR